MSGHSVVHLSGIVMQVSDEWSRAKGHYKGDRKCVHPAKVSKVQNSVVLSRITDFITFRRTYVSALYFLSRWVTGVAHIGLDSPLRTTHLEEAGLSREIEALYEGVKGLVRISVELRERGVSTMVPKNEAGKQ